MLEVPLARDSVPYPVDQHAHPRGFPGPQPGVELAPTRQFVDLQRHRVPGFVHHAPHRLGPLVKSKRVRILAGREARATDDKTGLEHERRRLARRLDTGPVTVVAQHDLVRVPGQQPHLPHGQRRSHARHHPVDAGQGGADHVEVPLHQEDAALLPNGPASRVESVEQGALAEVVGLVRVDVLRRVVAQGPAAERQQPARWRADGKHEPVPEPVVGTIRVLPAARDQPRGLEVGHRQAATQVAHERLPSVRRETDAEPGDQLRRHLAPAQVVLRHRLGPQLAAEEGVGRVEGGLDPLGPVGPRLVAGGRSRPRQRHPVAVGHVFDRGGEVVSRQFHVQAEGVAAGAAAEAVVELPLRIERQGGRLLLVERAQGDEALAPALDLRVLAGDVDDVDRLAHRVQRLVGKPASPLHDRSCYCGQHRQRRITSVAPSPPAEGGAGLNPATAGCPRKCSRTARRSRPLP